eukprot:gene15201-biopygen3215
MLLYNASISTSAVIGPSHNTLSAAVGVEPVPRKDRGEGCADYDPGPRQHQGLGDALPQDVVLHREGGLEEQRGEEDVEDEVGVDVDHLPRRVPEAPPV